MLLLTFVSIYNNGGFYASSASEHGVHVDEVVKRLGLPEKKIKFVPFILYDLNCNLDLALFLLT